MRRLLWSLALTCSLGFLPNSSAVDIIAAYRFDGSVDTSSDTNTVSAASALAFNSSLTTSFTPPGAGGLIVASGFSTNVPTGGGTNSRFVRTYVTGNNIAQSLAANNFASFSITADSGFQLNLQSLSMDVGSTGVNANGAGDPTTANTASFAIRSNLDGFSSTIGTMTATATNGTTVWTTGSVDLSGAAFQGLSDITFRMYIHDSFDQTIPSGFTGVNRFDNVIVVGTVTPIPEPTSILTLSSALLGGFAVRRLRRPRLMS
jgi:hypothetical protein